MRCPWALVCAAGWIAAFANVLFQKGILKPGELAVKMEEVAARNTTGSAA
jgi:hypothetical protein